MLLKLFFHQKARPASRASSARRSFLSHLVKLRWRRRARRACRPLNFAGSRPRRRPMHMRAEPYLCYACCAFVCAAGALRAYSAPTPRFLHVSQRCCSDAMRWPSRALISRLCRARAPVFCWHRQLHTRTKSRIARRVVSLHSEPYRGRASVAGKPGKAVVGALQLWPQQPRAPRRPCFCAPAEAPSSVETTELGGSLSRPRSRRRTQPLPPPSAAQL